MEKYPALIVVEGKSDKDLIDSFMNADIVITNGSEVSRETISYIKEVAKKRDVIVLTDPDSPGKRIRDVLNSNIPGLLHAYIPKEKAIKRHKVGVAESSKEVVLEALSHLVPNKYVEHPTLTFNDLMELGLVSSTDSTRKRDLLDKKFHVGHTNGKSLLVRCNSLGLTRKDLEEALHE
jgi:ribonuclease M5